MLVVRAMASAAHSVTVQLSYTGVLPPFQPNAPATSQNNPNTIITTPYYHYYHCTLTSLLLEGLGQELDDHVVEVAAPNVAIAHHRAHLHVLLLGRHSDKMRDGK